MNPETNQAAQVIFKTLGKRQRFRRHTNLDLFYKVIHAEDASITEKEFLAVFKDLQTKGAGSLVFGRKDNPNRFIWNFNLKEVSKVARQGKDLQGLDPLPKRAKFVSKLTGVGNTRGNELSFKEVPKQGVQNEPIASEGSTEGGAEHSILSYKSQDPSVKKGVSITIQLPDGMSPEDMRAFLELAASLNK